MPCVRTILAAGVAIVALPVAAADDVSSLKAELQRLAARIEALEQRNAEMAAALASERVSENEPEVITRLKAVEFQTLSMQKQARQIEALKGVSVSTSLTAVAQRTGDATAAADGRSRINYRGDIAVTLPAGESATADGKLFAHVRLGQGTGIGLRPTYTSTPNTTAFQTSAGPDDSFAILAQAWYQLAMPLGEATKSNAREHLQVTVGKIDPFVFFDQNTIADDESTRFLDNVFVHNPLLDSGGDTGADQYGFAPGAIVRYENGVNKGNEWALSLGVFGSGAGANFSGSPATPFVIAQAETAARFNYLPGNYRVYAWTNGRASDYDGARRRHTGIGLSFDQMVADELTLFGRYGQQTSGRVRFGRALTLGGELAGSAWGRGADSIGLALGSLRTSTAYHADALATDGHAAAGHEQQLEVYYRYRLTKTLDLSPDLQWIRRAGGDPAAATIKIVGLRARLGI